MEVFKGLAFLCFASLLVLKVNGQIQHHQNNMDGPTGDGSTMRDPTGHDDFEMTDMEIDEALRQAFPGVDDMEETERMRLRERVDETVQSLNRELHRALNRSITDMIDYALNDMISLHLDCYQHYGGDSFFLPNGQLKTACDEEWMEAVVEGNNLELNTQVKMLVIVSSECQSQSDKEEILHNPNNALEAGGDVQVFRLEAPVEVEEGVGIHMANFSEAFGNIEVISSRFVGQGCTAPDSENCNCSPVCAQFVVAAEDNSILVQHREKVIPYAPRCQPLQSAQHGPLHFCLNVTQRMENNGWSQFHGDLSTIFESVKLKICNMNNETVSRAVHSLPIGEHELGFNIDIFAMPMYEMKKRRKRSTHHDEALYRKKVASLVVDAVVPDAELLNEFTVNPNVRLNGEYIFNVVFDVANVWRKISGYEYNVSYESWPIMANITGEPDEEPEIRVMSAFQNTALIIDHSHGDRKVTKVYGKRNAFTPICNMHREMSSHIMAMKALSNMFYSESDCSTLFQTLTERMAAMEAESNNDNCTRHMQDDDEEEMSAADENSGINFQNFVADHAEYCDFLVMVDLLQSPAAYYFRDLLKDPYDEEEEYNEYDDMYGYEGDYYEDSAREDAARRVMMCDNEEDQLTRKIPSFFFINEDNNSVNIARVRGTEIFTKPIARLSCPRCENYMGYDYCGNWIGGDYEEHHGSSTYYPSGPHRSTTPYPAPLK